MKILVSTNQTQGTRPGDFTWAPEGEIVTPAEFAQCDSHTLNPGEISRCGCHRSFTGIDTGKGTTTALIADHSVTRAELVKKMLPRLTTAWGEYCSEEELRLMAKEEVKEMLRAAAMAPVGTVIRQDAESIFEH